MSRGGPRRRRGAAGARSNVVRGSTRAAGAPAGTRRRGGKRSAGPAHLWTAAALDGTQEIVRGELARRFGGRCRLVPHERQDEVHFTFEGEPEELLRLATAQSLLLRRDFAVQRPRTLLSPEHMTALVELVERARALGRPPGGFRFDAAGAGSPTMGRIAAALEERLGMPWDPEDGDCLITFRPGRRGWEVLCRAGNRPLASRDWRRVDWPVSLNAAIAACMVELSRPRREQRYLNLMCGAGTLLIERLLRRGAATAVGVDNSREALAASRGNLAAAGLAERVRLVRGDARATGFPGGAFDAVTADLPWGGRHGSRGSNRALYGATLAEAARLCRAGGIMVMLTQDSGALRAVLGEPPPAWDVLDERRIVQRSYRPLCLTLRRRG